MADGPGLSLHVQVNPSVAFPGDESRAPASFFFSGAPHLELVPDEATCSRREDLRKWVYRHGGCDAYGMRLLVTLQSRGADAVAVGMPRVVDRVEETPDGWLFDLASGGLGGPIYPRRFHVELDYTPPAIIMWSPENACPATPWVSISAGESHQILMEVRAYRNKHSFRFHIPVIQDGVERLLEVSNDGSPFILVGPDALEQHYWSPPWPPHRDDIPSRCGEWMYSETWDLSGFPSENYGEPSDPGLGGGY